MKLYATTTSDRATKGQGGNEYLKIELSLFDGKIDAGDIVLSISKENKVEIDYISQGGYITTLARFQNISDDFIWINPTQKGKR